MDFHRKLHFFVISANLTLKWLSRVKIVEHHKNLLNFVNRKSLYLQELFNYFISIYIINIMIINFINRIKILLFYAKFFTYCQNSNHW